MKFKSLQELGFCKATRLLIVFPHPDDETPYAGGLIQQAKSLGVTIKLVVLTNGAKSTLRYGLLPKANLVQARAQELQCALNILGPLPHSIAHFTDGNLTQEALMTGYLIDLIGDYQPNWILTYGDDGVSGHTDHIALAHALKQIHAHHKNFCLLQAIDARKSIKLPHLEINLSYKHRYNKLKAIIAHRSQFGCLARIIWTWLPRRTFSKEKFLIWQE